VASWRDPVFLRAVADNFCRGLVIPALLKEWSAAGNTPEKPAGAWPDATYPGMWLIRHPDGRLSEMVNLSRAKDAATSLAVGTLNADKRRPVTPPIRETDPAATLAPNAPERIPAAAQ
jgi:hypothetical protein